MLEQQPQLTTEDSALQQALEAFRQPPIQAEVRPQLLTPNEPEQTEEAEQSAEDQSSVETEEATEEEVTSDFAQQFKEAFGVDLESAKETLNQLQAFQEEQQLMRHWQLNPSEYDERVKQVRDFYSTLPEDGKAQFNSVEGAIAIWDHLQKQGANTSQPKTTSTKANSRIRKPDATPKQKIFSKREIAGMNQATYDKNRAEIAKAFREGRVTD